MIKRASQGRLKKIALKSKIKSLKKEKIKAWSVFSKYIRARDKACVTCGSTKSLQAGHFWHGVLDFDEININAQCTGCNHYKSGNLAAYASYLIRKYGIDEYDALEKRHYKAMAGEKYSVSDYEEIQETYQNKLKGL